MSLIEKIETRLITSVAGVNVHFIKNDEFSISYVILKRKGNQTKITASAESINTITELSKSIGKSIPVWLSITGRQVIIRKLASDPGSAYLNHILPNAREDDFLVNLVKNQDGSVFISAIRAEQIQTIASEFSSNGITVLGLSLGAAPVSFLYRTGLLRQPEIVLPGYSVTASSDEIIEIRLSETNETKNYSLENDTIKNSLILPFAISLSYLANRSGIDKQVIGDYKPDAEAYTYKIINRSVAYLAMGLFFFILLINFFIFTWYNNRYQMLSSELSYQRNFFSQRDSLRNELALKTNIIKQAGLGQNTEFGYYADRIASTVPNAIVLERMSLNPLTEKIKTDQPVSFRKYIYLSGKTAGSIILNEWINTLEDFDWIRDIEIVRYEKTENRGDFELKIYY